MPLNKQSTLRAAAHRNGVARDEGEDARRVQLVEVTIDSLAEVGYVGTTLAEIAGRAGVDVPQTRAVHDLITALGDLGDPSAAR